MILLFAFACLSIVAAASPQVVIDSTTLTGQSISPIGQEFFGGIPFASSPVGKLRFQPPVLTTTLSVSSFDASKFGPACVQPGLAASAISEDCLTINILRPADTLPNASLPVMAWIYGGGFTSGASSQFNGSAIVAQSVSRGTPVIYVNFNYRLGPLGFPRGDEAAARGALNLGLKDQRAALQWVQRNINAFGGDKSKVTVFGESAGAVSLAVLFLDPDFGKLARAGIFESGSAATTLTFTADNGKADWENFVKGVPPCASDSTSDNTFACLQAANSTELLKGIEFSTTSSQLEFPWSPTLDGQGGVFPDLPSNLYKQGTFAHLPFIAGTNLDEGTLFSPTTINSENTIHEWLIANFTPSLVSASTLSSAADTILKMYPDDPSVGSPYNTGNQTFGLSSQFKRIAAILDDISFQAPRRLWIQAASNAGVKTFGYLFTDPQTAPPPFLGVVHGSEIAYVYGSVGDTPASSSTLSGNMIDYWVSFAVSLDPNDGLGNARPTWSQYTPKNQVLMQLNGANTALIADNYREKQISFINSDPVVFHHKRQL
ncbi:hypothetical protein PLICRDRAFT_99010 [Plicaturopsis crispa FD-325 SS-3]|nr:hypothetical protein PLICRDRAFT_99010 [Plicaturopsis crispa FD-325 SS-3]